MHGRRTGAGLRQGRRHHPHAPDRVRRRRTLPRGSIEARGRKFTPPRKTTLQSYEVPERQRVYENRIHYPLKRKHFDPNGERHPELRGKDEYVRISWDEALEPGRRRDHAHPRDLRSGGHHRHDLLPPQLGLPALQAGPAGALLQHPGLQPVPRQPGQLGGLALGRHPHLGLLVAPGPLRAVRASAGRPEEHRADHLLVGRPQQHLLHVQRPGEPHLAHLDEGAGHPVRGHRPVLQLHRRHHGRQVDRPAARHRRRAGRGHRLCLAHRGHLRQLLRREPHLRVRRVEEAHPGRRRTARPRPRNGRPRSATSRLTPSQPLAREWAAKKTMLAVGSIFGATGACRAGLRHRVGQAVRLPHGHAGLRQARRQLLGRHRRRGSRRLPLQDVRLLRQRLGRLRHRRQEVLLPRREPGHPEDLPPPAAGDRHESAGELDRRRLLRQLHRAAVPPLHLPGARARTARPSR